MPKMIFINLPVTDLAAATRFYAAIGCTRNMQFSDDNASCMVWSESIMFMLLKHEYFSTFTPKQIANAHAVSEVLMALSCDTRADVDRMVETAAANGGKADIRASQDLGFMYGRTFADPDGHIFEPAWMDPAAVVS
ncbi:MAG: VOC family protein [Oricola sp.]